MIKIHLNKEIIDLSEVYATNLFVGKRADFDLPNDKLAELLTSYTQAKYHDFIHYVRLEYNNILKATPDKLAAYVEESNKKYSNLLVKKVKGKKEATRFSKLILNAMRYDAVRKEDALPFFSAMGIKTCVYCNVQSALIVEKENKKLIAKFELDHFYPKAIYPHLSTAFFNLLPSCSTCNKPKGNKVYGQDELFYLYHTDVKQLECCEFILDPASQSKFIASNNLDDITITFKSTLNGTDQTALHNKLFCIQGIYDTQKDVVAELFHVHNAYSRANKMKMLSRFKKLFPDEGTFKTTLIGTYIGNNSIHKRTLTKFRQDIANQIGLLTL